MTSEVKMMRVKDGEAGRSVGEHTRMKKHSSTFYTLTSKESTNQKKRLPEL